MKKFFLRLQYVTTTLTFENDVVTSSVPEVVWTKGKTFTEMEAYVKENFGKLEEIPPNKW